MALERILALSSTGASLKQLTDTDTARVGRIGAESATGPASVVIETASGSTATLSSSAFQLSSGANLSSAGGTAQIVDFDEWQNDTDITIDANSGTDTTITLENAGAGALAVSIDGDTTITGDLTVQGTTTSIGGSNTLFADDFVLLNSDYVSDTAVDVGFVFNIDPASTSFSISDITSNVITVSAGDPSAVLAAANFILITGQDGAPENNGIFEVLSVTSSTITIDTTPAETISQNSLTDNGTTEGTVVGLRVCVLQCASTGTFQVADGTSAPLSFTALATGGGNSLQQSYDQGNSIQLSDTSGDLTIDTDDTGTRANFIVRDEAGTANYFATNSGGTAAEVGSSTVAVSLLGATDASNSLTVSGSGEVFSITATGSHTFTGGDLDIDVAIDSSSAFTNSGGEMLFSGGNLQLNDSIPFELGTSADDSVIHNGTNTVWTHATGDLIFDNTNTTGSTIMRLGTDTSATDFQVQGDGGTARFTVTGSGTSVTSHADFLAEQNVTLGNGTADTVDVPGTFGVTGLWDVATNTVESNGATETFGFDATTQTGSGVQGVSFSLVAGTGSTGDGAGGDFTIAAGDAGTTNATGGNVMMDAGTGAGANPDGDIRLGSVAGLDIELGRPSVSGGHVHVEFDDDTSGSATGSLQVDGGVYVAKAFYADGNATLNGDVDLGSAIGDHISFLGCIDTDLTFCATGSGGGTYTAQPDAQTTNTQDGDAAQFFGGGGAPQGGAGGGVVVGGGAGGAAGGGNGAGVGGAGAVQGGAGGASDGTDAAGTGGAVSSTGGTGGAGSGSVDPGDGGDITITGGDGGTGGTGNSDGGSVSISSGSAQGTGTDGGINIGTTGGTGDINFGATGIDIHVAADGTIIEDDNTIIFGTDSDFSGGWDSANGWVQFTPAAKNTEIVWGLSDGSLSMDWTFYGNATGDSWMIDSSANTSTWDDIDTILTDNTTFNLGSSSDFSMVHNATNTIASSGTGDFILDNTNATGSTLMDLGTDTSATDFGIRNDSGTVLFEVDGAGSVQVPSGSTLDVDGTANLNGNVNLGSDAADNIAFLGDTTGDITPNVDQTDTIGSASAGYVTAFLEIADGGTTVGLNQKTTPGGAAAIGVFNDYTNIAGDDLAAALSSIDGLLGTSATPWNTASNVVNLDTSTDNVTIGSATNLAKLGVDGDTDEIQLLVQGNGTQTNDIFVVETSAGADLFTVDNSGNADVTGVLTVTGNTVLNGNVDLGSDGGDTVSFLGDLDTDIIPDADQTRSLGSSSFGFVTGFFETADGGTTVGLNQKTTPGGAAAIGVFNDYTNITGDDLAAALSSIDGLLDTADTPWNTASNVVNLDTSTDNVTIGSATNLAKLGIDGDTDEIQLLVQGNGTQTNDIFVVETSTGTDLFTVDNSGNIAVSGTGDFTGNLDATGGLDVDADGVSITVGAGNDWDTSSDGANVTTTVANGDYTIDVSGATNSMIFQTGTDSSATEIQFQNNSGTPFVEFFGDSTVDFSVNASDAQAFLVSNGANIFEIDTTSSETTFYTPAAPGTVIINDYLNPGADGSGLIGDLTTKWMDGATDNWNGMPYSITDASGTFTSVMAGIVDFAGDDQYFGGIANGSITLVSGTNAPLTPVAISGTSLIPGAITTTATVDLAQAATMGDFVDAINNDADLGTVWTATETASASFAAGDFPGSVTIDGGITVEGNANWNLELAWAAVTPASPGDLGTESKPWTTLVADKHLITGTSGAAITAGAPVYLNGSGQYVEADASAESTSGVVGICVDGAAGSSETVTVAVGGKVTVNGTLSAGDEAFLSEATGEVTGTAPSTSSSVVKPLGYMISSTVMAIRVLMGIVNA